MLKFSLCLLGLRSGNDGQDVGREGIQEVNLQSGDGATVMPYGPVIQDFDLLEAFTEPPAQIFQIGFLERPAGKEVVLVGRVHAPPFAVREGGAHYGFDV